MPAPNTCIASHIINIPYQSVTFLTIYKLKLTHYYHSKSIVYIIFHSQCYIFLGFGQIHNDIFPHLQYQTDWLTPKSSLFSSLISLYSQPLATAALIFYLHCFVFSRIVHCYITQHVAFSTGLFCLVIDICFLYIYLFMS